MNGKYYIHEQSFKDFDYWLNELVEKNKLFRGKFEIIIQVPFNKFANVKKLNYLSEILVKLQKNKINSNCVSFAFEAKDYVIDKNQLELLKQWQQKLAKSGAKVCFYDIEGLYSLETVEKTHKKIDKIVEKIKRKNLSPLESLMYAYLYITARKYNQEDYTQNPSLSRSIYGVLNSDKIVCVGYSTVMQAIVNNLHTNSIVMFQNAVFGYGEEPSMHQNAIVYLKDNKYKVDGYYYLDPTWDHEEVATKTKDRDFYLNHFLLPFNDIKEIVGGEILDKYTGYEYFAHADAPEEEYECDSDIVYSDHSSYDLDISFSSEKLRLNRQFKKILNDNIKLIDELNKTYHSKKHKKVPLCDYLKKDDKLLQQALYHNSQPIDLDVIIDALYSVIKTYNLNPNDKSLDFLMVKNIIDANIDRVYETFNVGAQNAFNQCTDEFLENYNKQK